MPRKRYEYHHELAQSKFDHKINQVIFEPDLTAIGREGWRLIKIIPSTQGEGWFDLFFERPWPTWWQRLLERL